MTNSDRFNLFVTIKHGNILTQLSTKIKCKLLPSQEQNHHPGIPL